METVGEVVSISDESITVRCASSVGCSGCRAHGRCVNRFYGFGGKNDDSEATGGQSGQHTGHADYRTIVLPLPDKPVSIGQQLSIEIPERLGLHLALIAYGLPIALLLSGSLLARLVVPGSIEPDIASIAGGTIGFIGGLFAYTPLSNAVLKSSELSLGGRIGPVIPIKRI